MSVRCCFCFPVSETFYWSNGDIQVISRNVYTQLCAHRICFILWAAFFFTFLNLRYVIVDWNFPVTLRYGKLYCFRSQEWAQSPQFLLTQEVSHGPKGLWSGVLLCQVHWIKYRKLSAGSIIACTTCSVCPAITFQWDSGLAWREASISVRSDGRWVISHSCLGRHPKLWYLYCE